ncbi:MAG: 2-oxoacid:acceptor oxidoreductase subunit alpha, partial [Oscillochloris sp.]|nr:2-oxoacid:acceptor oxidoreductase subunit alpha [Oscillochloris sp.]
GSQTANNTIIRAIFKMGIPVNGKNLFPSNIQGEPTWFTIRVSKDGYTARPDQVPILVAFNPRTANEDLAALPAAGICLYPGDGPWCPDRADVTAYPLPVKSLVAESGFEPRMRDYAANMVYVGALAALIGIDLAEIRTALEFHFKGKPKPVGLNYGVVQAAHAWMADYLSRSSAPPACPYRLERMEAAIDHILIDGNNAAAMGSVFGGVSFIGWYPITPATGLADGLAYYLPRLRTNPDGTASYAIVQAEDEIAALGMLIGAGWAGARAMTSTSGPGISLMSEFAGLGYFAEIPCVIWDVQRVGPSTGMPTRTSQGDLLATYFLGHGDTRQVLLLPGSVGECFEFGWRSFDIAEELQTPVFVLSDLDLGVNLWMSPPFAYPNQPMRRGKVLSAEDLKRLGRFVRFEDPEGDGVGARTLPGNPHPLSAQLSRGTSHNEKNVYSEKPSDWVANMQRLARKHETARRLVPQPIFDLRACAEIGIVGYGSSDPAIVEARDMLRKQGVETSYMRVRALPMDTPARAFVAAHQRIVVVEQNHDGQLRQLLQLHCTEHAARIHSVAYNDGLPLTAQFVAEKILEDL